MVIKTIKYIEKYIRYKTIEYIRNKNNEIQKKICTIHIIYALFQPKQLTNDDFLLKNCFLIILQGIWDIFVTKSWIYPFTCMHKLEHCIIN